MDPILDSLQQQPALKDFTGWRHLSTRYGNDPKYTAQDETGTSIFHINPLRDVERKQQEFCLLQQMHQDGLAVPEPLDLIVIPGMSWCCSRYRYLEGMTVRQLFPLGQESEYRLGREVGQQLKRLHTYAAPSALEPWANRCFAKHQRYVDQYRQGRIRIQDDQPLLSFIERHIELLDGRPNRFQHDDLHLDNLIADENQFVGLIDFSNHDFGDPWHDFVKMGLFQVEESVPFAVGQLDGYFDGEVPEAFWVLYSVYLAMAVFSSVVWTERHAPLETERMKQRLAGIVAAHHQFEQVIPDWYEDFRYSNSEKA